jgi:pyrroloquinoline quinone biosynthesis protein B
MGHLPQSGTGGMMEILADMHKPRKILIHINNSNPILNQDSEPRKILAQQKIEVAHDGMEITL